jgi:hypothetical protein
MTNIGYKPSVGQDIVSAKSKWKYTNHCIPPNHSYLGEHSFSMSTVLEYSTRNSLFSRLAKSHSNALHTKFEFKIIKRIQEMWKEKNEKHPKCQTTTCATWNPLMIHVNHTNGNWELLRYVSCSQWVYNWAILASWTDLCNNEWCCLEISIQLTFTFPNC